jgi:hypothetical protein
MTERTSDQPEGRKRRGERFLSREGESIFVKPGEDPPRQLTRPKKGKPVEIPVPTRADVLRGLEKLAQPDPDRKRRPARDT